MVEPSHKHKVFISWSLSLSHEVALILRDWIPRVIQGVGIPWVSSEDIEKGSWWNQSLISALEGSTVGIVVITPANLDRPWINFEAGALARAIGPTGGIVAPLLVDVPGSSISGPLGSLQVTRFDSEEDFLQLVKAINSRIAEPLGEAFLEEEFKLHWPILLEKVRAIAKPDDSNAKRKPRKRAEEILEDLIAEFRDLRHDVRAAPGSSRTLEDFIDEWSVLQPIKKAFASEGMAPNVWYGSITKVGTVRIFVDEVLDLEDAATKRAHARISSIPKYLLVRAPESEESGDRTVHHLEFGGRVSTDDE